MQASAFLLNARVGDKTQLTVKLGRRPQAPAPVTSASAPEPRQHASPQRAPASLVRPAPSVKRFASSGGSIYSLSEGSKQNRQLADMRLERLRGFALMPRTQMRRFGEFNLLLEFVGNPAPRLRREGTNQRDQQQFLGVEYSEHGLCVHLDLRWSRVKRAGAVCACAGHAVVYPPSSSSILVQASPSIEACLHRMCA